MSLLGTETLHAAASRGNLRGFKQCIDTGTPIEAAAQYGETAMHCALGRGRLNVASFILSQCPRALGWRDMNAKTPLHYAAR